MNQFDDLLKMYQNKISKNEKFEDIKKHIISHQGNDIFLKIEKQINEMFKIKKLYNEKNKKYYMLLCNPRLWYEGTKLFEVNELLLNLNDKTPEPWKINKQTLQQKMKKGDLGIIKVGEDGRTIDERKDYNEKTVSLLKPGIYGIFKVVGEKTYIRNNNECFVDIVVIDNLFAQNKHISKKDSIALLGESNYTTKSSKKIESSIFENIMDFIEK